MSVRDYAYYVCSKFSDSPDVGRERVHFLLFLAAWRLSLSKDQTLSSLRWICNDIGPYSETIDNVLRSDDRLKVFVSSDSSSAERILVIRKEDPVLSEIFRNHIDQLIERYGKTSFLDLSKLVFSTYPILASNRGYPMDLPALAKAYLAAQEKQ